SVPAVRRGSRLSEKAAVIELLAATLPELRRGLSDRGARALAHQAFEKLGLGAVSVTDRSRVLAFAGPGGDHHGAGDEPMKLVFEALAANDTRVAPFGFRVACGRADCPLRGPAIVVPLRLSERPVGTLVVYATKGKTIRRGDVGLLNALGDQLSAQLQLSELAGSARAAASAELQALQAQIEPHFLFNCLNTIASFIRTEPDRARELLLAFADYCRWTLVQPGEFVSLGEELRHLRSYLALEEARFGPQLDVRIDASPEALEVNLPPFLVQPLVENAIRHGKSDGPLQVVLRAYVRSGRLRVIVRDNGRGIAREVLERVLEPRVSGDEGTGLGLSQVHRRLTTFYGEGVRLKSGAFGTIVRLDVPAAA
ncbi:MAG: histidine kinase, partial [Actinomycetota bacterium]|nr:histidine kinase [Actinomycetota bacterium]